MDSDYYVSTGKKVGDFFWGFFCSLAVAVLLTVIGATGTGSKFAAMGLLGGLGWLVGVIAFFGTGRRFIAIGMLCALLVPLLAVGACFLALSGARW